MTKETVPVEKTIKPPERRRAGRRRLGWTAFGLAAGLIGFYRWQPLRYDFIPRSLPENNPWTEPEPERLFRKGAKICLITAHPDDSEFYLAGLLTRLGAAGAEIHLIVATDGDKGYYPFEDAERNRRVRRQEQETAAAVWQGSLPITFLGYPDGRLDISDTLIERLVTELRRIQPEYVFVFDKAYPPRFSHSDHRRIGEAGERAVRKAGVGSWLLRFSTIAPNYAVDVTEQWQARLALLRIHGSQFYGMKLDRVVGIITRQAVSDGSLIGTRYAEGLRVTHLRTESKAGTGIVPEKDIN